MTDPFHVLKVAIGHVLRVRRKQMQQFLDLMEENDMEAGKQQLLCSQINCIHAARWTYVWPGKDERMTACDDCMAKARFTASAMGFELGDVQELSKEMPIKVEMDFGEGGKPGLRGDRISTVDLEMQAEFDGSKSVVIVLSNAEVTALVVPPEGNARCYPISKLRIRFHYMDEIVVISCEDGVGANTKWVGEESGRDYMELIEPNYMRFVLTPEELVKFTVEADA